ncbi:MAG: outer membrane protein assembly factor BamB [Burkholderiales bacterium]|jgi:outer membrane protein assembly factor BamB|nr:outer membrane protein assembly factor BamB [Burkholderiales bacterium]
MMRFIIFALFCCIFTLAACSSSNKKPPKLAVSTPNAPAMIEWRASSGNAGPGFVPAVVADAVYVASKSGRVQRLNGENGNVQWTREVSAPLSAGPGADYSLVVVGTTMGEVVAFGDEGSERWRARVSSEIVAPPAVSSGLVVVFTADNRVHALSASDGSAKWMFQRSVPSLIVRNHQGATTSRGALFFGTAGGRLLAVDLESGNIAWDVAASTPKGATELERISDVTSRPLVEENQVCAAAFQGRITCFDIMRGTPVWTRDIPSYSGIVADAQYLYVSDDKGALHALDKKNGASVWKNETLAGRWPSGPQLLGYDIAVIDIDGYLHVFDSEDGHYLGRMATDGSAATAQPQLDGDQIIWQSKNGNVYSVVPR